MKMEFLIYSSLFGLILLITAQIYKIYKFKKTMECIPTPLALVNGNFNSLFKLAMDPEEMFNLLRKFAEENYPRYRISVLSGVVVALLGPNDVELVISGTKHMRKSHISSFLRPWLGDGLLTSSGTKWQHRRKILTPAFHFNVSNQFVEVFNEETSNCINYLKKRVKSEANLVKLSTKFTLQSITEAAMGLTKIKETKQTEYKNAIFKFGDIVLGRLSRPIFLIKFFYDFSKLAKVERETVKILHGMSNQIIKEKKKEGEFRKKRFLDILLKAKAEGVEIDNDGIREEVDTFMFEGHDTSAMAITFVLWTLAKHKGVQERIFEEIDTTFTSETPTYQEIQSLKYTERCIKECLRLYPSVPFITRLAEEDFTTITGYKILKGTIIHLHIFDIHRNPKIYPEPLKFDPGRFLPANVKERHPFAFIPFSAGPRNCIGQRFALLEIKASVCGLIRNFVLEPVEGVDVKFRTDLVLRPMNEVKIKLIKRPLSINKIFGKFLASYGVAYEEAMVIELGKTR